MLPALSWIRRARALGFCALLVFCGLLFCGVIHGLVHPHEDVHSECLMGQCVASPTLAPANTLAAIQWVCVEAAWIVTDANPEHRLAAARTGRAPPTSLFS